MGIVSGVPAKLVIWQNNTQDLELNGMQDAMGNFVNDATGTATLLDGNRNPDSVLVNLAIQYINGTNGNYVVTIPSGFETAVGSEYTMVLDGSSVSESAHFHLEIPVEVKVRKR
jgi:hypothetical protein